MLSSSATYPILCLVLYELLPALVFAGFILHSSLLKLPPDLQLRSLRNVLKVPLTAAKLSYVLYKYSHVISIINLCIGIGLALFQAQLASSTLQFSTDIDYYLKVNIDSYDAMQGISDAQSLNSMATLGVKVGSGGALVEPSGGIMAGQHGFASSLRRLFWQRGNKAAPLRPQTAVRLDAQLNNNVGGSLGGTTGSKSSLSLVYHSGGWENVLTNDYLVNLCISERAILAGMPCINTKKEASMISATFDENCAYYTSYSEALPSFGLAENANFVEDNVDSTHPKSAILISFFQLGTCHDTYDAEQFQNTLDSFLYPDSSSTQVTFVEATYMDDEFLDAIVDAGRLSAISLIVCMAFLVLGVRGIILATTTLLCIVISIAHASALLTSFGYSGFSAFNVMSVFIMIGVGVNAVLLFAYAWRDVVAARAAASAVDGRFAYNPPRFAVEEDGEDTAVQAPAHDTTDSSTGDALESDPEALVLEGAALLEAAYRRVAAPVLFTTLAAILSLFSKLISPVVVISQLGAFMGVAVIVFYTSFHWIIIPVYAYTARWKGIAPSLLDRLTNWLYGIQKPRTFASVSRESINSRQVAERSFPEYDQAAGTGDQKSSMHRSLLSANKENQGMIDEPHQYDAEARTARGQDPPTSAASVVDRISYTYRAARRNPQLLFALLLFFLIVLAFWLVYVFILHHIEVDFGIPQLFPPDSNLGEAMFVAKNYKSDVFSMDSEDGGTDPGAGTHSPTPQPTGPTIAPTVSFAPSATAAPTSEPPPATDRPTIAPSTFTPTPAPTINPPPSPTPAHKHSHTDYSLSTCWGIRTHKEYLDSEVQVEFDFDSFQIYMAGGRIDQGVLTSASSENIVADMESLCAYVAGNRHELNVHPDWNASTDCIYQQYNAVAAANENLLNTVAQNLLAWGASGYVPATMVGVQEVVAPEGVSAATYSPIWVCGNFSLRSNVTSLMAYPDVAIDLNEKWNDAFSTHGASFSETSSGSVKLISGSDDFTFPLLAAEVLSSIEMAAIISVTGFVALLVLFTRGSAITSLMGTLGMVAVLVLAFLFHMLFVGYGFDLLDIVVLIAITGMVVDFPIHLIMESESVEQDPNDLLKQISANETFSNVETNSTPFPSKGGAGEVKAGVSTGEQQQVGAEPEASGGGSVANEGGDINVAMHSSPSTGLPATLVSIVAGLKYAYFSVTSEQQRRASRYTSRALLGPLILTILSGVPLLFAIFQLLRKTGEYIIILGITSYVFCVLVLPFLLIHNREQSRQMQWQCSRAALSADHNLLSQDED